VEHPKALAALAFLLAAACASLPSPLDRPFRTPGEKLVDFPEDVRAEYGCEKKKLPWLQVESQEIWPKRVRAGEELGHRLVYALCTASPTEVVPGTLETRIVHRGKATVLESLPDHDLRPGRWTVDVFLTVPPDAPDGVYALEIAFKSASLRFERQETFAVEPAAK
jgi:hypothetical protein